MLCLLLRLILLRDLGLIMHLLKLFESVYRHKLRSNFYLVLVGSAGMRQLAPLITLGILRGRRHYLFKVVLVVLSKGISGTM